MSIDRGYRQLSVIGFEARPDWFPLLIEFLALHGEAAGFRHLVVEAVADLLTLVTNGYPNLAARLLDVIEQGAADEIGRAGVQLRRNALADEKFIAALRAIGDLRSLEYANGLSEAARLNASGVFDPMHSLDTALQRRL